MVEKAKASIISSIIAKEKANGKLKTKEAVVSRQAELSKMSDSELSNLIANTKTAPKSETIPSWISTSSDKTASAASIFSNSTADSQKEVQIPLAPKTIKSGAKHYSTAQETQLRQDALDFLVQSSTQAKEIMLKQASENGVLGTVTDGFKAILNVPVKLATGEKFFVEGHDAADMVEGEVKSAEKLQSAIKAGKGSFEFNFEKERGVKFDPKNIEKFKQSSEKFLKVTAYKEKYDALKADIREFESAWIDENTKDARSINPNNPQVKSIEKDKRLIAILDKFCNGDVNLRNEYLKKLSATNTKDANFATKLTSGLKQLEKDVDSAYKKELDGKSYEHWQNEYNKDSKAAFGEKNSKEMAEAYMQSQKQGIMFTEMGITIATTMLLPGSSLVAKGGVKLAQAVGTQAAGQITKGAFVLGAGAMSSGLHIANAATSDAGITEQAKTEAKESLKAGIMYGAIGGYISAPLGQIVQNVVKTQPLVISNAMAKAFSKLPSAGKVAGFTTEVSADSLIQSIINDENLTDALKMNGSMEAVMRMIAGGRAAAAAEGFKVTQTKLADGTNSYKVLDKSGKVLSESSNANEVFTGLLKTMEPQPKPEETKSAIDGSNRKQINFKSNLKSKLTNTIGFGEKDAQAIMELAQTPQKIKLAEELIAMERFSAKDIQLLLKKISGDNPNQTEIIKTLAKNPELSTTDILASTLKFKSIDKNQLKLFKSNQYKYETEDFRVIFDYQKNGENPALYSNNKDFSDKCKRNKYSTEDTILFRYQLKNLEYLESQGIKDPIIKEFYQKQKESLLKSNVNTKQTKKTLEKLTLLLEVEHSSTNKSHTITGEAYDYLRQEFKGEKSVLARQKTKDISESFESGVKAHDENPYRSSMLIKNELQNNALKTYIAENSVNEKVLTTYLYDKFYLSKLAKEPREICEKINDEFGTKIFIEDESNPYNAKMIYEELSEWKKISKENFKAPDVIDLSQYKGYYAKNEDIRGFQQDKQNAIYINGENPASVNWTLRHEMTHANDQSALKQDPLTKLEFLAIKNTKTYKQEFLRAGIDSENVNYAYKNRDEFLAVAAEGDYSKYSQEFKAVLIRMGMPEYVFDMTPKNKMIKTNNDFKTSLTEELKIAPDAQFNISFYTDKLYNSAIKKFPAIQKKFHEQYQRLDGLQATSRIKDKNKITEKTYRKLLKIDEEIDKLIEKQTVATTDNQRALIEKKLYKLNELKSSMKINYAAIKNSQGDVAGQRVVVSKEIEKNTEIFVENVIKGVENDEYIITTIENYAAEDGQLYLSSDQVQRLKDACRKKGIEVIYQETYKDSGYTTAQMNLIYKNNVHAELQFRGDKVNVLAEREHILYDIREKKDIAKGNKDVENMLQPIYDALKVIDEDDNLKKIHNEYLQKNYKYCREVEMTGSSQIDLSMDKSLPEVLDLANIEKLEKMLH